MLRLLSVCHGLRAAWALTSSPRTARCPPSPPAPTTKTPPTSTTATTITTCSSTHSAPPQTLHPSSPPQAALLATGRPATRGPPPPPITATATTSPCHGNSRCCLRPAATAAPCRGPSATPSCPRPRRCRRHTASLSCSSRLLRHHHHCPPPPSWPPTSPAWEACLLWFLHRTKRGLWSNTN